MSDSDSGSTKGEAHSEPMRPPRRDLIGCLAGLLLFPLTFFVFLPLNPVLRASVSISTTLLVLAAISSFFIATRVDWGVLPRTRGLSVALRLGAMSGLIVFLVGGGSSILAVTFYLLRVGIASDSKTWSEMSIIHVLAVLCSLVPAVAIGSLGSILHATSKLPGATRVEIQSSPPEDSASESPKRHGVIPWAILLFVVSLLSPAVPQTSTPPSDSTASLPMSQKAEAERHPLETSKATVPSPPKFNYESPPGLKNAMASEWTVEARRTIKDLDTTGPVAISQNSRHLAFRSTSRRGELSILDLRHQEIISDFHTLPHVRSIAWSPNSERIFCVCDSRDAPYWIIDTADSKCLRLPVWSSSATSDCIPVWWRDDEIHLLRSNRSWLVLNLASLGISGAANRPSSYSQHPLPETSSCRVSVLPIIRSCHPTSLNGDGEWGLDTEFYLASIDRQSAHAFHFRGCPIPRESRFVAAPDSTILVVIGDSEATAFYFGLQPSRTMSLRANLPKRPDAGTESRFHELLGSGQLGVFVCSPLVNPLNSKVVGPNRTDVRGIARILSWEDSAATLVVADHYSKIDRNCVLTDLHFWQNGQPVLIDSGLFRNWWASVLEISKPSKAEPAGPFPRWEQPGFQASAGGVVFRSDKGLLARTNSPRLTSVKLDLLTSIPSKDTPEVTALESHEKVPKDIAKRIGEFIRAHHGKVTRRDLRGYASDYHHTVDFYDHGQVSRDIVFKDQAEYLPNYIRISETVEGDIRTKGIAANVHHVTYNMRSDATRLDGSRSNKLIQITMTIGVTADRIAIMREKARVLKDDNQ